MRLSGLVRIPGFAAPFGASLVGRIPVTAVGLTLVLHVEALTGSYALAGLSAGAFSLGLGASAPVIGRLIDRRGQAAVLAPCTVVATAGLLAIAVLPGGAPPAAIALLALASGVSMPPLGSCLRALWVDAIPPESRHAAFALDSATTEVTYVLGPVVIAEAIGSWSTRAALGAAAALVAVGAGVYLTRPVVRAWRSAHRATSLLGPLTSPAVRSLLGVLALTGVTFGAIEVGVAAAAEASGVRAAAGPLLGAWGVGSIVGGLVAARRAAPRDPALRAVRSSAALALSHLPLVLTGDPVVLAPLLLVAGTTIAPALSTIFVLLGDAAPRGTVTETFTWATTGIAGGIALGAAVGGLLADVGHAAPFALGAGGAALGAGVAAVRRGVLAGAEVVV